MNKTLAGIIAGTILTATVAIAHPVWQNNYHMGSHGRPQMHTEMTQVFEKGDYKALEQMRDKYQMPVMPWIDDQAEFDQFKESNQEPYIHDSNRGYGRCWR